MIYDILSATLTRYGDGVVLQTVGAGEVHLSLTGKNNPEAFKSYQAWLEAGNTPEAAPDAA